MGKIQVLPEIIANKIAAGEVIERPSSVVKELVENALDADARSIEITVEHGGKSLIRIADDGSGMSAEDAELAFQRHATSKIYTAADLEAIASYGFRGEALASISAVSRVCLKTRAQGTPHGTEVSIEGGRMNAVRETPCREGTIIEVRDLFFNTPARRKFLRTDTTELSHITDAVSDVALAVPEIAFTLKSGTRTLLELPPAATLTERAAAIFGEDHAKHLVPLSGAGGPVKVSGLVGKPYVARANKTGQVFLVNGRVVKSSGLSYALQDGYHGLLMHGQYPVAVVSLEIDPAQVDVNVHPTKQEVRISGEREVRSFFKRCVAEALERSGDLAPDLRVRPAAFPGGSPKPWQPFLDTKTGEGGEGARYPRRGIARVPGTFSPAPNEFSSPAPLVREADSEAFIPAAAAALEEPISVRDEFHITKVLGQIHHTFIVAETEEGFIVVDQHAAHERVMFEALVAEIRSGHPKKQGLLMDAMLDLEPRQLEIFREAQPVLEKLGFDAEEFGEKTIVIRAYPAVLKDLDPAQALKQFLEEKEEGRIAASLEHCEEDAAALIACKRRSVKAHDAMTPVSQSMLLKRLAACANPFHCPHGRPTFFKTTFLDLEKQFKRK